MMDEPRNGKLEQDLNTGLVRMAPSGEPYTVTTWAAVDLEAVKSGEPRRTAANRGRAHQPDP